MIIASIRTDHPDHGPQVWKRTFPEWNAAQAFADMAIGLPDNSGRIPVFIELFDTETGSSQDYYVEGTEQ